MTLPERGTLATTPNFIVLHTGIMAYKSVVYDLNDKRHFVLTKMVWGAFRTQAGDDVNIGGRVGYPLCIINKLHREAGGREVEFSSINQGK